MIDAPVNKSIASEVMTQLMQVVTAYEDHFLDKAPEIAEVYRFIGLYRVFTHPVVAQHNYPTWFVQLVLETEIQRDHVKIDTVDQLDEYCEMFMHRLKRANLGMKNNPQVERLVTLGFNNIYDAKGFNDED